MVSCKCFLYVLKSVLCRSGLSFLYPETPPLEKATQTQLHIDKVIGLQSFIWEMAG